MIRYFNEDDEIQMKVQSGPEHDAEVAVDAAEAVPGHKDEDECNVKGIVNPVAIAKASPESVPVAAIPSDDPKNISVNAIPCKAGECKCEFYVDLNDVATFANFNEMSCLEALNAIIECNEDDGMRADNTVVVCRESDMEYAEKIDAAGGNCLIIKEEDDISVDVQVGPNKEEISQTADSQDANPVDAVKRQYDNVIVAKQGDEFFTDVEDVQKCADLNCESAIETLNGIIAANEAAGLEARNLVVVCNENTNEDLIDRFNKAGVEYCFTEGAKGQIKSMIKSAKKYAAAHPDQDIDLPDKDELKAGVSLISSKIKALPKDQRKALNSTLKQMNKDVKGVVKSGKPFSEEDEKHFKDKYGHAFDGIKFNKD